MAEKFSVDECIKIIDGIMQLWKNEGESTLRIFTHIKWPSNIYNLRFVIIVSAKLRGAEMRWNWCEDLWVKIQFLRLLIEFWFLEFLYKIVQNNKFLIIFIGC